MQGAIAAGHPKTAEAGLRMFEAGGNAFDAALAALAAACVVEPVLTSLGGGGFLLARPRDGKPVLLDFFVQTPQARRREGAVEFFPVMADFGVTQQEFHIGAGAVATPGTVRGLVHARQRLGSQPLREILAPAIAFARDGVEVNALQAYIFSVVEPIYRATPAADALYGGGALQGAGTVFHQPELADTLAWIAEDGDRPFYEGELGARLAALCADQGGHLTLDDLRAYRVIERAPLHHGYRGLRVATNPAPSSGGMLLNYALAALDQQPLQTLGFGSAQHLGLLAEVMAQTNLARQDGMLARSEQHRRLMEEYRASVKGHPVNTRGTTHISTIDDQGNGAALTLSNGEGCGRLLSGSGIMLNNMLGEEDLNPDGFDRWPCDTRVSSMMAPTLAEDRQRLIALGSGGSNRLRTAILQTLCNLVDFAMAPAQAVGAPRIHFERGRLDIEPGYPEATLDALQARYPDCVVWDSPNLFFGGAHTVCWDGRRFTGAGDTRRGGVFAVSGTG
jgi:gamma-glutamyltranspeptidase/glutathione hydrolase